MNTTREQEAVNGKLEQAYSWIHAKEAWVIYNDQEPKGVSSIALRTFINWCRQGKHGLVCRQDRSKMIVVRKDTIPTKELNPIE